MRFRLPDCIGRILKTAALSGVILCVSCMTMADYNFSAINSNLAAGDYSSVVAELASNASSLYSKHDKVLESLNLGVMQHYSGEYDSSNQSLSCAEELIYQYYAKSVTQNIGSFFVNDNVIDYAGETFEDIYTNVFMALNYLHLNKPDDVLVEVRRIDNKLKTASLNYQDFLRKSRAMDNLSDAAVQEVQMEFHNSALARYLSMLAYLAEGDADSAAIDRDYVKMAFQNQPHLYDFAVPQAVDDEFSVPAGMARLNVLGFTGLAPAKKEEVTQFFEPLLGTYFKLALPVLVKQPDSVAGIRVSAMSAGGGAVQTVQLEKIESIENIALDTYQQASSMNYTKAILRSMSKTAVGTAFGVAARSSDDNGQSLGMGILQLLSMAATDLTERADVRTSRFFPASAYIGGMNLAPGMYDVKVEHLNASGGVLKSSVIQGVSVQAGKINLVEDQCLR